MTSIFSEMIEHRDSVKPIKAHQTVDLIEQTRDAVVSISWHPGSWKWKLTKILMWLLGWNRRIEVNEHLHILWEILRYPGGKEVFAAVFWLDGFMDYIWEDRRNGLLNDDETFKEKFIHKDNAKWFIARFLTEQEQIVERWLYWKTPIEKQYWPLLQWLINQRPADKVRLALVDCVNALVVVEEILEEYPDIINRDQVLHFVIHILPEICHERLIYRDVVDWGKWTIEEAINFRLMEWYRITKNFLMQYLKNEQVIFVDVTPQTKRKLDNSHYVKIVEWYKQAKDNLDTIFKWQKDEFDDFERYISDAISYYLDYFKPKAKGQKIIT